MNESILNLTDLMDMFNIIIPLRYGSILKWIHLNDICTYITPIIGLYIGCDTHTYILSMF